MYWYPGDAAQHMAPGPAFPSALPLQDVHRSERAWADPEHERAPNMRARAPGKMRVVDPRFMPYLVNAGFHVVAQLPDLPNCSGIVDALLNYWRPEYHVFQFPTGEMTITLQDVEVLLGLPVEGLAITGKVDGPNYKAMAESLVGKVPTQQQSSEEGSRGKKRDPTLRLDGNKVYGGWVEFMENVPDPCDDLGRLEGGVRACLLRLIGYFLLPDKDGNKVSLKYLPFLADLQKVGDYSWGSAVLAYTYREFCRCSTVGVKGWYGCGPLLTLWFWERFPYIATLPRNISQPPADKVGLPPSCWYAALPCYLVIFRLKYNVLATLFNK